MQRLCATTVLCTLAILLLTLAGCGGGSSSPDALATVSFSGVVEDGPIENAKISLRDSNNVLLVRCGPQGNARCETASDATGAFSLQLPAGIDLATLSVVAVGGRDRATGVDFTGVEMRTPLELLTGDVTTIVISPLTTLIAELRTQGLSLAAAKDRLRDWLALPAASNLAARPSANLDLQRRALLLSKIVLELNALSAAANPFVVIAEKIDAGTPLLVDAVTCNSAVLNTLGLVEAGAQTRIVDLQTLLAEALTVEEAASVLKNKELMDIFAASFRQMLSDTAAFDEQNVNYQKNLKTLAVTTLNAAGSEVIPLGGTIPQRIARYILFTYQLRTPESLTLEPDAFGASLQLAGIPLENDPWIAELARSRSLYSAVSPLLLTELPGNDNQLRLAYFYGSDLSPHYRAEQLIGQVFDDAINDAVLLKIVEGKANAGLIDETRAIIATQIVQSEPKAHAYRALANALINFNQPVEARSALDLARDLYRKVVAAKGVASSTSTDVDNLLATSASYRKAGDLANAQSLLDDVAVIAQALASSATTYGRLITGIKTVADDYIAAGDFEAAAPLVEAMDNYSGQTPALAGTYKLRVYNWSESAKRYADLGNSAMVLKVYSAIQALRSADGLQNLTEAATWVYVPSLVESLYRVGETQHALTLANSIPSGSTYLGSAFKLVATYEALHGNLETAFNIADNVIYFPKDEEKVDLLTYYAANHKNPYIALTLINAGPEHYNDARQALEKAEQLLDNMAGSSNLVRIRYGYVKVAELYTMIGDIDKATALLQRATAEIIDDVYRVAVMADIALGYHSLNQTETARTLLVSAQSLADADPTGYRADTTPVPRTSDEAAALIYEKLIKSYEKMGEKSLVSVSVNLFLPWVQQIHSAGTVDDLLAGLESDYLQRAALYLEGADDHAGALKTLAAAKESAGQIAVVATRLKKYLSIIGAYAAMHEELKALDLALSLPFTAERNQGIQALANATIGRDDFPESDVASIDSDGDGKPDFFHPLVSTEEIAASGLTLDDDSDGDGIVDTLDFRPLFVD